MPIYGKCGHAVMVWYGFGREGGRGWKRISGWDGGPGAVVDSFCCVLCALLAWLLV